MYLGNITYKIRNPHNLGWRVLMLECCTSLKIAFLLIQLNNFYLIRCVFDEGTQGESEVAGWFIAEIYCVEVEVWLVSVYLFLFWRSSIAPSSHTIVIIVISIIGSSAYCLPCSVLIQTLQPLLLFICQITKTIT